MRTTEIEKVLTFFRGLDAGDAELAARHVDATRFVQHARSATDDFARLREQIAQYPKADGRLRVIRAFQDGDYVFTQAEGDLLGQNVFFDVLRLEDGAIVERWAFSDKSAPPNPSGHTQADGPVEAKAGQDTEENKALVRQYYEVVHIGGRHGEIPTYLWEGCVRHEPGVRDGMTAFISDVEAATARGKLSRSIDEIEMLLGQGDFVFITARGSVATEPCTFVDLYRVDNGQIAEHWGFPEKR